MHMHEQPIYLASCTDMVNTRHERTRPPTNSLSLSHPYAVSTRVERTLGEHDERHGTEAKGGDAGAHVARNGAQGRQGILSKLVRGQLPRPRIKDLKKLCTRLDLADEVRDRHSRQQTQKTLAGLRIPVQPALGYIGVQRVESEKRERV
jgi:hypothetical protein